MGFSRTSGGKDDRPHKCQGEGQKERGRGFSMGPEGAGSQGSKSPDLFAQIGNFKQLWLLGTQTGKKQVVTGKQVSRGEKGLV